MTERERERQAAIYEGEFAKQEEKTKALEKEIRQSERDFCYRKGYADGKRDAMKWISVNERLPEKWKPVLAMVAITEIPINPIIDSMVYIGNIKGEDKWRVCWNHDMIKSDVTHWMPLPDPPKKEV